jgi:hypothetical protein
VSCQSLSIPLTIQLLITSTGLAMKDTRSLYSPIKRPYASRSGLEQAGPALSPPLGDPDRRAPAHTPRSDAGGPARARKSGSPQSRRAKPPSKYRVSSNSRTARSAAGHHHQFRSDGRPKSALARPADGRQSGLGYVQAHVQPLFLAASLTDRLGPL